MQLNLLFVLAVSLMITILELLTYKFGSKESKLFLFRPISSDHVFFSPKTIVTFFVGFLLTIETVYLFTTESLYTTSAHPHLQMLIEALTVGVLVSIFLPTLIRISPNKTSKI